MNIVENLDQSFRLDVRGHACSDNEIKELAAFAPFDLPEPYLALLKIGSDFEFLVEGKVYLRIWGALGAVEMNEAYDVQEQIPYSLAIGDDEGGGALVYIKRDGELGLYLLRLEDLDQKEAIFVSKDLDDLLTRGSGVRILLSG